MNTTTIGLDIAKTVFQVHGMDARGQTTLQRRLRRTQLVTFFANLPRAWWVSRPAGAPITGRVS